MMDNQIDKKIKPDVISNYFDRMINNFFKILPMKENNETSLVTYMQSLQEELIGCREYLKLSEYESLILSLVFTLQFLIDNQDCTVKTLRKHIFKSISICEKVRDSLIDAE